MTVKRKKFNLFFHQSNTDVPMVAVGDSKSWSGAPGEALPAGLNVHPGKKFFPKKFAGVGNIIMI